MRLLPYLLLACSLTAASGAERINHEGRILGDPVTVPGGMGDVPILFNAPAADAVVSSMQIMPRNSAWNEDISNRPVHANSANLIARIRADLVAINSNRNTLKVFPEMNYVLVPDNQPSVEVRIRLPNQLPEEGYPDDSDERKPMTTDRAMVPYPTNLPVEPWQWGTPGVSNVTWQADPGQGDRHCIVVMPGTSTIWESWIARREGGTPPWVVSVVAKFDIGSNTLRPLGWTSADAAGLPMFPALIRYDECERGVIEHALRIVVNKSRKEYIYPATHYASAIDTINPNYANYPAMGQRVRLPSTFSIPAGWTKQSKAVANALKKYGAMVADNGGFFSVSCCPDERFPATCFNDVQTIDISSFEVIDTTLAGEGPRAGTAPVCNAGPDQGVTIAAGATLNGSITTQPVPAVTPTTLWEVYATPTPSDTATITAPGSLTSTVSFSAVGTYTLLLKASDGTHTPAYDAVVITVAAGNNPAPTLTTISPTMREQNSGAFTLTLNGSNFVPASQVAWTGRANLNAVSVNGPGTQLTVAVPASYLSSAGNPTITVFNPTPGGGTSSGQILAITADVTAPVISVVAVSGLTTSGATITWTTNEGASSQVDYGFTAGYGSSTTVSGTLVTSHSRALSGLTASTLYHYRVRSTDGAGNPATSGDATFTTATPPPAGGGGGGGGSGGGGGCGLGGAVAALLALGALWLRR